MLQHRRVEAAATVLRGRSSGSLGRLQKEAVPEEQQSQNTTKRRSPTSSHQAGCHRPRRQPVGWEAAARLLRGSSGSLGTLEKEAVPEETASWMPQAQTPSWRWTQQKRLRQKNSWLGSCSETFEGGQAAVSEDYKKRPCQRSSSLRTLQKEEVPQAHTKLGATGPDANQLVGKLQRDF